VTASNVLVVDDDPQVRRAVTESLRRKDFTVTTADGVEAAVATLETETFDAVVLDMVMPNPGGDDGRAGISVLKAVAELCPRPAAVILTAYDSPENTLETLECGADAYLAKAEGDVLARRLPQVLKQVMDRRRGIVSDPDLAFEFKRARDFQRQGFPRELSEVFGAPGLSIAGYNLPAVRVSGDTYDFAPLAGNTQIAFMLCDALGHGPTGALISSHLRAIFRLGIKRGWSLTAIDGAMRDSLSSSHGDVDADTMYATGILGMLHTESRWIELLVAGHPPPSFVGRSSTRMSARERLCGPPWGDHWQPSSPALHGFEFKPGHSVLFFSDGLLDARNRKDEKFGIRRLRRTHQQFRGGNAIELCEHVLYKAVKFGDLLAPHEDDVTVLAVHWALV